MRTLMSSTVVMCIALAGAAPASAQSDQPADAAGQTQELQAERDAREARYQIGQMERLLEGAVEHGATVIRDRLRAMMPADMLLTEDARARGFRLEGYGMFFDVEVPSLAGTLPWSIQTLDQNDLGLQSALRTLKAFVDRSASDDVNLQQALKRVELQVAPAASLVAQPAAVPGARNAAGSAASMPADAAAADPILSDPNEAYRTQIREALVDTMLEHSRGLSLGPTEVLTVAARGIEDRPRLAQVDNDTRTVVISIHGADLTAFLAGQISREEARKRVEVRVF